MKWPIVILIVVSLLLVASCTGLTEAQQHFNNGRESSISREFDKAIVELNKAIELDPKYAFAYSLRAMAYARTGNYTQALADATKSVQLDPKSPDLWNNRAAVYLTFPSMSEEDIGQVIADANKALELDPKFGRAYNNRAQAYEAKGEWDRVIADTTKALELGANRSQTLFHRAKAYAELGQRDLAIKDLEQVVSEAGPKLKQSAQELLEQLR